MFDIAILAKLARNPSDLPAAAKALGMQHEVIAPGERTSEVLSALEVAFAATADAAQQPGAEVILLQGAPSVLKGKKVRILAVLEQV